MKYHATLSSRPFMQAGLTPSQSAQIINKIELWIRSSGPEWTVSRLKELKQVYLLRLCGKHHQPDWLAMGKDGIPKGPFKPLYKRPNKANRRVLDALMVYTGIMLKKVSRAQSKKFFESVDAEPVNVTFPQYWDRAIAEVNHFAKSVAFQRLTYRSMNLTGHRASCDVVGRSAPNTCERFVDDFRTTIIWDLLDDPDIEPIIADSLDDLYRWLFRTVEEDVESNDIGRISIIQEKGCKARFIAVPRLTVQLGLQSLGRCLLKVCEEVPWDCTHNQTTGLDWAQCQLQNGKRLWSVDVSDFTNHWPLDLIERMLRELHLDYEEGDIKLFHACARNGYRYHDKRVVWTKGQPLGVFPSFPAAALSHGIVLRALELEVGVVDTFRVLGDDVIINDERVHRRYREFLLTHHIPVSIAKTLENCELGEFAGGVITSRGHFIPRKVLIPKPSNLFQRIAREERGVDISTTENEFIGAILGIMEGTNPDGLTLYQKTQLLYLVLDKPDEAESAGLAVRKHLLGHMREYYSSHTPEDRHVTVCRNWLSYWVERTLKRVRQPETDYTVSRLIRRMEFLVQDYYHDQLSHRPDGTHVAQTDVLGTMWKHWYHPTTTQDPPRYYRKLCAYCEALVHLAKAYEKPWSVSNAPKESTLIKKFKSIVRERQVRVARCGKHLIEQEMMELYAQVIELLTD